MLLLIEIGFLSGCLTIFLNYCIGKPAGEFSPYEIFSRYTVWLSIKRLQNVGLYQQYIDQYNENILRTDTVHGIIALKNDFKKMLYDAAEPYFTWERAVGMCPVCTGVWIAWLTFFLGMGLNYFAFSFVYLIIIIVISHITIRILSKLL